MATNAPQTTSATAIKSSSWFPGGERAAFVVGFALALYGAYVTVRPVLLIIVLAAAIASLAFGLFRRIARRLGGRRKLAAVVTVFALFLGIFVPLGTLAGVLIQRAVVETAAVASEVRHDGEPLHRLATKLGPVGRPFERLARQVQPRIASTIPTIAQRAAQAAAAVGGAIVQLVTGSFLLAIGLYYFFLDGEGWRERLIRLMPLPAAEVKLFLDQFRRVSLAVLLGNLGTAVGQGAVATVGYVLFGAPLPVLWGIVTIVAALVPLVGSALIWVPLSIVLALQHGVWRGIGLAAFGVLAIGGIDNLLRPLLTRRGLRMHPFLSFVAIFGGVATYGFPGLFLGPLVIALAVTVIDLYERRLRLRGGGGDGGGGAQLTLPLGATAAEEEQRARDEGAPQKPEPQSA